MIHWCHQCIYLCAIHMQVVSTWKIMVVSSVRWGKLRHTIFIMLFTDLCHARQSGQTMRNQSGGMVEQRDLNLIIITSIPYHSDLDMSGWQNCFEWSSHSSILTMQLDIYHCQRFRDSDTQDIWGSGTGVLLFTIVHPPLWPLAIGEEPSEKTWDAIGSSSWTPWRRGAL